MIQIVWLAILQQMIFSCHNWLLDISIYYIIEQSFISIQIILNQVIYHNFNPLASNFWQCVKLMRKKTEVFQTVFFPISQSKKKYVLVSSVSLKVLTSVKFTLLFSIIVVIQIKSNQSYFTKKCILYKCPQPPTPLWWLFIPTPIAIFLNLKKSSTPTC